MKTLAKIRQDCKPEHRRTWDSLYRGSAKFQEWTERESRGDAVDTAFAARQVEYVYTVAVAVEFPELAFTVQDQTQGGPLVPWDTTVPEGADSFVYYLTEDTGTAVFFAVMAAGGLPSPSIMGAEVHGKIEGFGNQIKVTVQQLRRAAFAGVDLDGRLGEASKRGHAQLLNDTAAWGYEALGIPGFLNHPQVARTVAAEKVAGGTSTHWDVATPGEMIADVLGLYNSIPDETFRLYYANTIAMPDKYLTMLAQTRLSEDGSGGDTTTVLEYLLKPNGPLNRNGRTVKFRACEDLLASRSLGWLDDDAMIAFHDDPKYVRLVVPLYYRVEAVQQVGFDLLTPTESSIGGIQFRAPASAGMMTGLGES